LDRKNKNKSEYTLSKELMDFKQMKNKKDIVISTRVNEKYMKIIKQYADQVQMSTSKLLRNALRHYTRFVIGHKNADNPIILFSKSELSFLLQKLNKRELADFAELCYQNGKNTRRYFYKLYTKRKNSDNIQFGVRTWLNLLNEFVFSEQGQNWFEKFQISHRGTKVLIAGIHNLNHKFSVFFKYLMQKYLEDYAYRIQRDELKNNKVILVFQK
jgi:hypothetical protein